MKRILMLLAAGFVALAFSACGTATTGTVVMPKITITPAQFFTAACEPVQQALALASMFSDTLSPAVEQQVSDATPMVKAACAAGATISIANVKEFGDTVLPAAAAVVNAAPATMISSSDKLKIGGAIALAELSVDTVAAVVTNATAAQAASAPVAASQ